MSVNHSQLQDERNKLRDELIDLLENEETIVERRSLEEFKDKQAQNPDLPKPTIKNLIRIEEIRSRLDRIDFESIEDPFERADFRANARANGTFNDLFPDEAEKAESAEDTDTKEAKNEESNKKTD